MSSYQKDGWVIPNMRTIREQPSNRSLWDHAIVSGKSKFIILIPFIYSFIWQSGIRRDENHHVEDRVEF